MGYTLYHNDHGDDMNLTSEMALAYHFGWYNITKYSLVQDYMVEHVYLYTNFNPIHF